MDTMTPTEPAAPRASATTLLLTVDGLAKSFGPTKALRACSLELRGGEVHALMGENGSGKSTLVKILAGVHRPDTGRIELAGRAVAPRGPREAIGSGVATVFQEVQCVAQQSVLDNLWLGTDGVVRRARGAGLDPEERRARAGQVLTELLGTCPDLDAPAGTLSLSERQALAIARSLLRDPRVLILDEATSALDVATRDRLFAVCRALTARGGAVLFISHRMDEVEQIADRVTVLRSGESVGTLTQDQADIATLVHLMTGGEALVQSEAAERPEPGEVVLAGDGLNLRAGEIIGLAGLEGQGQDDYLRALGALADPGTRVAYVARDRREESIFPPLSIRENFTASTLNQDARGGLISTARARARFDAYRDKLKIRLGKDGDAITTLSGGNQQKVVIARALAGDPRVLLLNDPTRGIDIGAKHDVYALLRDLAASGMAIVMLSTEVDEHLELMDRVLVFREGAPAAELDRANLSRSALVTEFFGPADAEQTETDAAPVARQAVKPPNRFARLLAERTWIFPALLAVALLIANVVEQHSFLEWHSWILTFAELATPGLAAMASTPAILGGGGGIDISVAPLFVMVSVVVEVMLLGNGISSAAVVIPAAILFGAAVGAVNGVLINYGRYQAVVATLCMNFILSGFALGYAPSPVSGTTGWLTSLGSTVGGVPGGLILLAVPLLVWALLGRTPFVRTLCAVGGSEVTAYTAGVNVPLVRTLGYTIGGGIAGLAGIAITAQLHQAEADTGFVTPFILLAIAAVALGGTSLAGGRGGLLGSLLGAAVIFLIENLLGALHISSFWSQAVYGTTLIVAVLFAARTAADFGRKAAR
ncbi:MAG TPA: ATP-binding cassette domain-containing protein [Actinospica sp.]|jgi:ABC-type sugar transport system ATPase subunit/ribose/xylose/arabinose/galactoside ABC-type transport system permease subunit|nr:ATP-binding cassette domain-containing protein [Actinospica sp.]